MGLINGLVTLLAPVVQKATLPGIDVIVGNLMKWMDSWIGNLGWTVVLFTLLLKLITFPLDFFSRRSMKIYSLKMEKLQPQMEKLEKQYANNKQLLQQKKMALQKKMGASALASCLPSIITIVLFFWVFAAFSGYIGYTSVSTYNSLVETYHEQLEEKGITITETDGKVTYDASKVDNLTSLQKQEINDALVKKYESLNRNFLWVKNVGLADVPWTPALGQSPSEYFKDVKDKTFNVDSDQFDHIMKPILESYKKPNGKLMTNGILVLPILAVGVSVLSQLITMKSQKGATAMNGNTGKTMNKVMMFIFPIMFLMFSLTSSTAFTVYMTTNSIVTILTTLLINFIVDRTVKIKEKKQGNGGVGYRRG